MQADSILITELTHSPELLLAGRVPEMEFDSVSVEFNVPDVEVHSDRGVLSRPEGVISEASMHTFSKTD